MVVIITCLFMINNLLCLGWWSVPIVGVETGVFLLCALADDDAVEAVIEALIGFGCFFGEPSETVGPTDCERPTMEFKYNF